jgi:hypothetical protein
MHLQLDCKYHKNMQIHANKKQTKYKHDNQIHFVCHTHKNVTKETSDSVPAMQAAPRSRHESLHGQLRLLFTAEAAARTAPSGQQCLPSSAGGANCSLDSRAHRLQCWFERPASPSRDLDLPYRGSFGEFETGSRRLEAQALPTGNAQCEVEPGVPFLSKNVIPQTPRRRRRRGLWRGASTRQNRSHSTGPASFPASTRPHISNGWLRATVAARRPSGRRWLPTYIIASCPPPPPHPTLLSSE